MEYRNYGLFGGGKGQRTKRLMQKLKCIERQLGRQRRNLQRQERRSMNEAKKAVKSGNIAEAREISKMIARNRKMATSALKLKTAISGVIFQVQSQMTYAELGKNMAGLVRTLRQVKTTMNVPGLSEVMGALEDELGDISDMGEEVDMGFDMISEDEEADSEAEQILGEIMMQQRVSKTGGVPDAPLDAQDSELDSLLSKARKQ